MTRAAEAEAILLREGGGEVAHSEGVREALERMLDELLCDVAGLGPRPTDGLNLRRESVHPSRFWAVGKAYLVEAPYEEPVWIEFVFAPGRDGMESGRCLFGIREGALTNVHRGKLQDLLLAEPREALDRIPWRHEFKRSAAGWTEARMRGEP